MEDLLLDYKMLGGWSTSLPAIPMETMVGWWKGRGMSLNDNDPTTSATDFSGTNNHAIAAGAARPTFKTGIANGHPVFRFDGIDDQLVFPNDIAVPYSVFVVACLRDIPANLPIHSVFIITTNALAGIRVSARISNLNWGSFANAADVDSGETLVNGQFSLLEITATDFPFVSTLYRNGVQKVQVNESTYGSTTINVMGAGPLKFDMAEIIAYNSVNPATQAAVRANMFSIYALP